MLSAFAGGSLFGARFGTGPPRVLALHGWRRTHRDWDRVLTDFDAVAVDLPGFGATSPPPEPWGLADYAEAVSPILAEMGPDVVVVGHSFGGSVAVELAASSGGVGALVLTGAPLIRRRTAASAPLGFRTARWLHRHRLFPDGRMEQLRRQRGSEDYRAATGLMRDTFVRVVNEDVASRLEALDLPVSLVWGAEDTAAPAWVAEEAHSLLPDSTLRILDGVTHDVPAEAPAELAGAIGKLLERQTPTP